MSETIRPDLLPLEPGNVGHVKYNSNCRGWFRAYEENDYRLTSHGDKMYYPKDPWEDTFQLCGPVLIEVVEKILVGCDPTIIFNTRKSLMHYIIMPNHFGRIMGLRPNIEP